jgi:hypothetical protein
MADWIPLLVRAEDYPELSALVAAREAGRTDGDPPSLRTSTSQIAGVGAGAVIQQAWSRFRSWPVESLRQLADSRRTYRTAERWCLAIEVACDHTNALISSAQMAEEAGMSINEWRDAPRKLPQHLKAHYPEGLGLPLLDIAGRDIGKDDQIYWGISSEQRDRWRQACAG